VYYVEYIRGFSKDEYVSIYSCEKTDEGVQKYGYTMFRKKNPSKELVGKSLCCL